MQEIRPLDVKAAGIPWGRCLARIIQPNWLLAILLLFFLCAIWSATLYFIGVERVGAEHATKALSEELVGTYEAQTLRALSEIDQTLKLVKYAVEHNDQQDALGAVVKLARQ